MTKYECTQKIKKRIQLSTKEEVAKELGISRPTLDARLSWNNWKVSEISHIEKL
jgi:predicted DNA binding protein